MAMEIDAVVCDRPFDRVKYPVDFTGADRSHQGEASDLVGGERFPKARNETDDARSQGDDVIHQRNRRWREQPLVADFHGIMVLIWPGPLPDWSRGRFLDGGLFRKPTPTGPFFRALPSVRKSSTLF
jgi:hypothetical protein